MYIGLGIFLLLVGLVIVFAYNGDQVIAGIDLGVIGWIAIILGVLAIVLSLFMSRSRRPAGYTSTRSTSVDPQTGSRVAETRVDPDRYGPAVPRRLGPARDRRARHDEGRSPHCGEVTALRGARALIRRRTRARP